MKIYLKIFFVILFISSMGINTHAWNVYHDSWYVYPFVCDGWSCNETESKKVFQYQDIPILIDTEIEQINFWDLINSNLWEYSRQYWNTRYRINDYASWFWTWTIVKNVTFSELLDLWAFNVSWRFYSSWKDYLFSNFSSVIRQYHSNSYLPSWTRKSELSNIHKNITWYTNWKFKVNRVCMNSECTSTRYWTISLNSTNTYSFLSWNVSTVNSFKWLDLDPKDSKISTDKINAWKKVDLTFVFEDYLDRSKARIDYEYNIYYTVAWTDKKHELFAEEIYLEKSGLTYKLVTPDIEDEVQKQIFKVTYPKWRFWWKVRIEVKESIAPTDSWRLNLFFTLKNKTSWFDSGLLQINDTPLVVSHSNWFWKPETHDVHFYKTDDLEEKLNSWFTVWDTIWIDINLKDMYWNPYYNSKWWFDISFTEWSSDALEIASSTWKEYWKSLSSVTSSWNPNYQLSFKIRPKESGYLKLNWFDIKSTFLDWKEWTSDWDKITWLIPEELYELTKNENWNIVSKRLNPLFVKEPPKDASENDFPISCTWSTITISSTCKTDNHSWCNNDKDELVKYEIEDKNSLDVRTISITDYAYNTRVYQYIMNHIDQTPPKMTLKKWDRVLEWDKYDFKASDDFYFEIEEKTTTTCAPEVIIDYKIEINWELVESWILKKENVNEVEEKDNYAYLRHKIDLTKYLSKAELDKKIKISLNDSYWNISEREVIFNIYPTDEWLFEQDKWVWNIDNSKKSFYTFKVSSQWDKYANMEDNYLYTVENLSDKFWNIIYDKKINYVKHDTTSTTWLKKIYINESKKNWWDALEIYDVSDLTSKDWNFSFNLRSYTPWEYSQYFESELYKWDDSYIPTGQRLPFFLNINWSPNNQFKKPILIDKIKTSTLETSSGALCKADTNWTWIPDVKSLLKYKIDLNNEWSVKNISDASLNINVDSIKSVTDWHKWLDNKLKEISNTFTDDTDNSCVWFKWQISATENILQSPVINTDNLEISYRLKWNGNNQKLITYILENSEILWCDVPTLWVKVEWTLQWDWKWELTWQETNFSDISMSEMRWTIRKNAFELIRNMNGKWEWQILNGIRYVEWNVTIWWEIKWYETLIVKNWNVFIDSDLNLKWDKFWIIVLKDNYNVNTDYKISWNVYIKNNVEKINAVVYADWTFKSAKDFKWTSYEDAELSKKLVLNWTLFTRNTIWWATELIVEWLWWDYLLPGWKWIKDYELAANYDLNFVRKAQFCEWDPEAYAFLVRYNAKIQTNPPKWFSSK